MGRAPCCDKANVKKGPWSPEEDAKLKSYIEQHGTGGNWIALPQKIGLKRCGKSCRLRWLNYLRPNLKHGGFSEEEDNIICSLYVSIGSRWSVIAAQLPGRTDNDIKNYWNTRLKKKLLGNNNNNNKHRNKEQHQQQEARSNNNNTSVVIVNKQESNNNNINRGIISNSVVGDYYCGDSLLSLLVPQNTTTQQNSYNWQQIMMPNMLEPIPQSFPHTTNNNNQQLLFGNCCLNNNDDDQEDSIKKLLLKLGGRFSSSSSFDDDDYRNYHPTLDNGFNPPHQFQEQVHHHVESSVHCISNGNNNNGVQFAHGDDFGSVHHGQGSSNATIEEMVSTNFLPQRLNGLEFFYGNEDMVSEKIILGYSRPNNSNWDETISSTTPIFHPSVREDTTQECALEVFNS